MADTVAILAVHDDLSDLLGPVVETCCRCRGVADRRFTSTGRPVCSDCVAILAAERARSEARIDAMIASADRRTAKYGPTVAALILID